jgi:hypothetical protein
MTPGANETGARTVSYLEAFRLRQVYRSAAYSRMFTREEMGKLNLDMQQIASLGAVQRVDESCMAQIDGGMERVPLWALNPIDFEFIEVYARMPRAPGEVSRNPPSSARPLTTSRNGGALGMNPRGSGITGSSIGGGAMNGPNSSGQCSTQIYAWTRK